jgi:hypothetical protein
MHGLDFLFNNVSSTLLFNQDGSFFWILRIFIDTHNSIIFPLEYEWRCWLSYGRILSIVNSGYIDTNDIYPLSGILAAQFNIILNFDIPFIILLIPFLAAVIAYPFYYLISRYICPQKEFARIILLLSSCFISGWFISFSPNHIANLLFPICIFIIIYINKNYSPGAFIILLLASIALPLYHIIPAIGFIALLISFTTLKVKEDRRFSRMALLASIISITWISAFYIWSQMLKKVIYIFNDSSTSSAGALVDQYSYARHFNVDMVSYFLLTYGITIILLISFTIIFFTLGRMKNRIIWNFNKFTLIIAAIIIIQLFIYTGFSPLRFLVYFNIIGIFYLGLVLFKHGLYKDNQVKPIVFVITICIFITGLLAVYPSSNTLLPNYQTTSSEMNGMEWNFIHLDPSYNLTGISIAPGRYASFLLGV